MRHTQPNGRIDEPRQNHCHCHCPQERVSFTLPPFGVNNGNGGSGKGCQLIQGYLHPRSESG